MILLTEEDEDVVVVVVVAELEEDVVPIGETPSTIHCINSLIKPTLVRYHYDLKNLTLLLLLLGLHSYGLGLLRFLWRVYLPYEYIVPTCQ